VCSYRQASCPYNTNITKKMPQFLSACGHAHAGIVLLQEKIIYLEVENSMEDLVIRGSGGLAREIAFLIERINQEKPTWNLLGYIDLKDIGEVKYGYEVLGDDSWLERAKKVNCVIAIGDSKTRFKVYQQIKNYSLNFPNLIHPLAIIGKDMEMGNGNIITGSARFTVGIHIGNFCLFNGFCTIGHDTVIKDFVSVMTFSAISGNVVVNTRSFIGSGAILIPGITIGKETMVGAGAVVLKNVKDGCTVFGNPAKIVY
jgi:sugar O-acyltransferase (sialic acid O-acetyltransferase NeuD family)